MWEELAALPGPVQRCALDGLAAVPHGARVSDLERWRKVPAPRGSGQSVVKYLDQIAEISGLGLADLGVEGLVPPRRLAELALYRMTAFRLADLPPSTRETRFALLGIWRPACFTGPHL